MNYTVKNIRTFIGAKNFEESRSFYRELGFEEVFISDKMVLFKVNDHLGFYLQKYYVKDWINNSMVFLEVDDVDKCWEDLLYRGLHNKYKYVRLNPLKSLSGVESASCMTHRGCFGTFANSIEGN